MEFFELYAGGGYTFCEGDLDVPCFYFATRDLPRLSERFLKNTYLELSVRQDTRGGLAYCLDLPDRQVAPWAIPLRQEDLPRISRVAEAGRLIPTVIRSLDGVLLDLEGYVKGLELDWSGAVAQAQGHFMEGQVKDALRLVGELVSRRPQGLPAAHHLLGRCHRVLGELPRAIASYHSAAHAASDPATGEFIPYAAGPLSDMAVAYKQLGDVAKAVHCFMRSLHLRPNHPEALLSFFSLFPDDERLVLYGAARTLAVGGRDELVEQYLVNYSASSGKDLALLGALARQMVSEGDLGHWPFASPEFRKVESFERGLGAPSAESPNGRRNGKHHTTEVVSASKKWKA